MGKFIVTISEAAAEPEGCGSILFTGYLSIALIVGCIAYFANEPHSLFASAIVGAAWPLICGLALVK